MDQQTFSRMYRQQRDSGMSRMAWCSHQGVSYASFNYWLKKYGESSLGRTNPVEIGFTELDIRGVQPVGRYIRILYTNGDIIEIPIS